MSNFKTQGAAQVPFPPFRRSRFLPDDVTRRKMQHDCFNF